MRFIRLKAMYLSKFSDIFNLPISYLLQIKNVNKPLIVLGHNSY